MLAGFSHWRAFRKRVLSHRIERLHGVENRVVGKLFLRSIHPDLTAPRSQLVRYFVPSKLVLVDNPLEALEVPAWD